MGGLNKKRWWWWWGLPGIAFCNSAKGRNQGGARVFVAATCVPPIPSLGQGKPQSVVAFFPDFENPWVFAELIQRLKPRFVFWVSDGVLSLAHCSFCFLVGCERPPRGGLCWLLDLAGFLIPTWRRLLIGERFPR